MSGFLLIAKTVLSAVVSAGVLAAIIAKIETMINPPHAHLGADWVIILFAGYAAATAFVCSLVGALIWKSSLDANWLKVVIGAVAVAELVVIAFILYAAFNR